MEWRMIKREKDMVLGNIDIEPLYTMKHFPIYMGVTDENYKEDLFADEEWGISKGSGMIQLLKLVPLHILYAKSHNASIGKTWERHHTEFAKFIHKNKGEKGILEVGGGNGRTNVCYNNQFAPCKWTIVEPSDIVPISGCTAKYERTFYTKDLDISNLNNEFDTLVHAHLMEHQFDIADFMSCNSKVLPKRGVMLFSVPNMFELLKRKYPYALNFEHTYFITEDYIDRILSAWGFEIFDKYYFEDHSIFYATKLTENKEDFNHLFDAYLLATLKQKNKELFNDYITYYKIKVTELNNKIINHNGSVYIFGAHINTQLLINFGLKTEKIKCIIDNDPKKQGHRLYGTRLNVTSPTILAEEDNPLVILIMGTYNEEIMAGIKKINNHSTFLL